MYDYVTSINSKFSATAPTSMRFQPLQREWIGLLSTNRDDEALDESQKEHSSCGLPRRIHVLFEKMFCTPATSARLQHKWIVYAVRPDRTRMGKTNYLVN